MTEAKKQPIMHVNCYPVSAAIWRNKSAKGETFYSTTITSERKYKDKEGKNHFSSSLSIADLALLAKAANLAREQILEYQAQDRAATQE